MQGEDFCLLVEKHLAKWFDITTMISKAAGDR